MKKLILFFVAFIGFGSVMIAQPEKDMKAAQKNLSKFYMDPSGSGDKLTESVALLESAFTSDEIKGMAKSWITRGKIFAELANNEFKAKTLNPAYKLEYPDASMQAFSSYKNALELAEKKNDKKDASSGVSEVENHLNNAAIFAYQEQKYSEAFDYFKSTLEAYDLLKSMGNSSRLEEEDGLYDDQLFFTAASGYYGKRYTEVKPFFEKLVNSDRPDALVYEGLYNIAKEEGEEDPERYLAMGREKFPDDTGLLFQEINHYLNAGKLTELITKLEQAIEKEPDNVSVHVTLGNVYDQLSVKASEDGNAEDAEKYTELALQKYKDGIAIDESNFDATYSIGAMYYNKAAAMVESLNELASDLSPAGMKNYDAKKIEMDEAFNIALPYFERAEEIKADDLNTIIALKEIYARLNDMEKSNAYKAKYDSMTGGQ